MIPCWPWLDLTRTLQRSFLRPCFVDCPWRLAPSEVFQMSPPEPPERARVGPQVLNVVGLPACSRQLRLPTLSRPTLIGVIPRQAVYRLPTALSLMFLTRSWDSSEARSEPWTAVSRTKPRRYQSPGQFVRSNSWRIPTRPMTATCSPEGHAAPTFPLLGFTYSTVTRLSGPNPPLRDGMSARGTQL